MRKWLQSLTRTPRGYAADGRRLGLGLATALEKQRENAALNTTREAEEYLRHQETPKADARV